MSTTVQPDYRQDTGEGWVTFAGFMIAIVAILNMIFGIAAISDSKFYLASGTYIIHDLNLYGWVLVLIGAVQFGAVFGIFTHAPWARWVGILTAGANAVVQLLWIAAYPFSALALLTIDILVIYGLIAHGHRRAAL
jgi:hypothetical protein